MTLRYENLLIFCSVAIAAWFLIIYFWPRILLNVYKRAVLTKGFEGPIPINTLATEPQAIFADPLHPPASATKLATTGVNHDTLPTAGGVRPEVWTASPVCARDGGSLLQRAVHCSEQHYFRLRRQAHHRYTSGRISYHGTGLERTGAERDEADFVAEQFGIRHRPHPRIQRQRPPDRSRTRETNSGRPTRHATSMMFRLVQRPLIPCWPCGIRYR